MAGETPPDPPTPAPAAERTAPGVQRMFDRVAPRYDLANTVFSLGQDKGWRQAAPGRPAWPAARSPPTWPAAPAPSPPSWPPSPPAPSVVGFDFSQEMLRRAGPGRFAAGDALQLPLADASVDVVTIAFGLRNLPEPGQGLLEFRRVLRPGGRLVVCEFSTPVVPVFRDVYRRYLTRLMPVAARRLTSDPEAYQYLARSIGAWPDQPGLARWIQDAAFGEVAWRDLTGGIVALHRGVAG